jgi:hypothetical protein
MTVPALRQGKGNQDTISTGEKIKEAYLLLEAREVVIHKKAVLTVSCKL